jgi:hypothetical protein
MMGDLDDIFAFGRRCRDESSGMDSVVNITIRSFTISLFYLWGISQNSRNAPPKLVGALHSGVSKAVQGCQIAE